MFGLRIASEICQKVPVKGQANIVTAAIYRFPYPTATNQRSGCSMKTNRGAGRGQRATRASLLGCAESRVAQHGRKTSISDHSGPVARALRVHVYPDLGDRTIGSLTPVDIRRLVAKWSENLAPRSVRRIYGALRTALNYAVEVDRLARTPCRGIHLPAVEPMKVTVPSPLQLVELADTIDPDYSAMIWLGAVLGLRWGEVAGLRVGNVTCSARP